MTVEVDMEHMLDGSTLNPNLGFGSPLLRFKHFLVGFAIDLLGTRVRVRVCGISARERCDCGSAPDRLSQSIA